MKAVYQKFDKIFCEHTRANVKVSSVNLRFSQTPLNVVGEMG